MNIENPLLWGAPRIHGSALRSRSRALPGTWSSDAGRPSLNQLSPSLILEEFIPDIARRWRQTNATRLAPSCLIDFLFVADCQAPGRFRCHEDRVTHFPARTTVLSNKNNRCNDLKFAAARLLVYLASWRSCLLRVLRHLARSSFAKARAISESRPFWFRRDVVHKRC